MDNRAEDRWNPFSWRVVLGEALANMMGRF